MAFLIGAFFQYDLGSYLTLENIKSEQAALQALVEKNPAQFIAGYFFIYVAVTALSIPGAAIMTLIAGALFGLWWGVIDRFVCIHYWCDAGDGDCALAVQGTG